MAWPPANADLGPTHSTGDHASFRSAAPVVPFSPMDAVFLFVPGVANLKAHRPGPWRAFEHIRYAGEKTVPIHGGEGQLILPPPKEGCPCDFEHPLASLALS